MTWKICFFLKEKVFLFYTGSTCKYVQRLLRFHVYITRYYWTNIAYGKNNHFNGISRYLPQKKWCFSTANVSYNRSIQRGDFWHFHVSHQPPFTMLEPRCFRPASWNVVDTGAEVSMEEKVWWVAEVGGSGVQSTTWRSIRSQLLIEVVKKNLHPRKLTCPLKRDYFSREYIFQPLIFRGHVSFQGSISCLQYLFFVIVFFLISMGFLAILIVFVP